MASKENVVRINGNGRSSSCVIYGGLVHVGAVTSVDIQADVKGQAKSIFGQIDRLLELHASGKGSVLSATVYLACMDDYADFHSAWDEWVVGGNEPTYSVVAAGLSLPEYRVAISLVAAQDI